MVRFKDLTLSDLTVSYYTHQSANGEALKLSWEAEGDRPAGQLHIANRGEQIERFEFADGTVLSGVAFHSDGRTKLLGTSGADQIIGGADDEMIYGNGGNDTLLGGEGTDQLYGGDNNDVLDAGTGSSWQYVYGYGGDDKYLFSTGFQKTFNNTYAEVSSGGTDTIRFQDLTLSDLEVSVRDNDASYVNGDELQFVWRAVSDAVEGTVRVAHLGAHIERFKFADGTTLSELLVNADGSHDLTGTTGNDRIAGTIGVDHLTGGTGSDTFVFTDQGGDDHVTDFTNGEDFIRIESGASAFADLTILASGSDALIQFGGTTITLDGVSVLDLDQGDFLFS